MKQRILLVGGNNKARSLARSLMAHGCRVTALNRDHTACLMLADIDGLDVVEGDGSKPYILRDLNVGAFDTVIAMTPEDDANLVICQLSKSWFGVPTTISVVSDPRHIDFFHRMGVDRVVCVSATIADVLEHETFGDENDEESKENKEDTRTVKRAQ